MEKNSNNSKTCYCEKCHSKIPLSTASTHEGKDYVYYFCGEVCLKKWELSKRKK